MHPLHAAVSALMRSVAAEIVLPHFRALAADEIEEKEPGDLVTVADRLAEVRLTDGLFAILPEARVIGEEAVSADPALLDGIGSGRLWLVDPIDGTGNYAAGRAPFAIMVALACDGDVEAGWILDPLTDRMCHATAGGGAFVDERRVTTRPSIDGQPIASLATRFLSAQTRTELVERTEGQVRHVDPPLCAGEQYPRLVQGENDFALFWRANPWDHAAGALFLAEAGGFTARADRIPYRIDDARTGLIAAASPALWRQAATILFG